jgi:hypothetical protein
MYHVTLLSNFARAFDKYQRRYRKSGVQFDKVVLISNGVRLAKMGDADAVVHVRELHDGPIGIGTFASPSL